MPVFSMNPTRRAWEHTHSFGTPREAHAERRTLIVVALTTAMMAAEAVAGWLTGSMALLADAVHMASHAGALGIAAAAYRLARRHAHNPQFTFGTGKVPVLAGYSSALALGAAAAWMALESARRLADPVPIRYAEAMGVAALGLVVNVVSARVLADDHEHTHEDGGENAHNAHVDHNLRAAYLHVLADALTSVLALIALAGGWVFGWRALDPVMGLVGSAVVGRWAWGLARSSAAVLLDAEDHAAVEVDIRRAIEAEAGHAVVDLHVWRVGPASRSCSLTIVAEQPKPAAFYRDRLAGIPSLDHVTVEVHQAH